MKKIVLSLMTMIFMCVISSCSEKKSEQVVSGNVGGHDYVDLGLPSGTLWAISNIGFPDIPNGDYFSWGQTHKAYSHDWSGYACEEWVYIYDNKIQLSKYNTSQDYGVVDNITVLEPSDDIARVDWGRYWRIPTREDMEELVEGCDWTWMDEFESDEISKRIAYNERGFLGKSKTNGNIIFFPADGYKDENGVHFIGELGYYWTSSLGPYKPRDAYYLSIDSQIKKISVNYAVRCSGFCVRAVCPKKPEEIIK